ncbi:hypothetical protein [Micromonospora chersina]|uniref:hypothetical protein n=1 Tax=Micromonospora chersina TaxID=47854 RepID=UPI0037126D42
MTLWDRAVASFPQWQEHLGVLSAITARIHDVDPFVIGHAEVLGPSIANRVADPETAPGGLYGFGLWSFPGEPPRPALFVQPGLAPVGGAPASITLVGALLERMQMPAPDGTIAMALPPPQPQRLPLGGSFIAPAMCVTIGSRRATLGLRVQGAAYDRAILTAGHAASRPGALVRDEVGDLVGSVLSRMDLHDAPPGCPTADVAIVQIDDRRMEDDTDVGKQVDAAQPLDEVRLARSDSTTPILGLSPAFALRRDGGSWGHVAITAAAISRAGDSGAPVHRSDGAVVGHIVAGYGSAYSLIQDSEYILRQAGVVLR